MMCFFLSSCANSYIDNNATHLWRHGYSVKSLCRCHQNTWSRKHLIYWNNGTQFIPLARIWYFNQCVIFCCRNFSWQRKPVFYLSVRECLHWASASMFPVLLAILLWLNCLDFLMGCNPHWSDMMQNAGADAPNQSLTLRVNRPWNDTRTVVFYDVLCCGRQLCERCATGFLIVCCIINLK